MEAVPIQSVKYRQMQVKCPNRWIICLLGSLRSLHNLKNIPSNPHINVLIVCLTDEVIEPDHLTALQDYVSQTYQSALMVLRYH